MQMQKLANVVRFLHPPHSRVVHSALGCSLHNYTHAQQYYYYYPSKSSICVTSNASTAQFIRSKHRDALRGPSSDSDSDTEMTSDFDSDDFPNADTDENEYPEHIPQGDDLDGLISPYAKQEMEPQTKLNVSNRFPPKLTAEHYARLVRLVDSVSDASITEDIVNEGRFIDSSAALLMELREAKSFVRNAAQMLATNAEPDDLIAFNTQLEYYLKIILDLYKRKHEKENKPQYVDDKGDIDFISLTRSLRQKLKQPCRFCQARDPHDPNLSIHHLNIELLQSFLNLRGMIYPRKLTGNCMRHQHRLAEAIRRARQIGLLNPTSNWKAPPDWSTSTPLSGEHLPLPPFNSKGYIDPATVVDTKPIYATDQIDTPPSEEEDADKNESNEEMNVKS